MTLKSVFKNEPVFIFYFILCAALMKRDGQPDGWIQSDSQSHWLMRLHMCQFMSERYTSSRPENQTWATTQDCAPRTSAGLFGSVGNGLCEDFNVLSGVSFERIWTPGFKLRLRESSWPVSLGGSVSPGWASPSPAAGFLSSAPAGLRPRPPAPAAAGLHSKTTWKPLSPDPSPYLTTDAL